MEDNEASVENWWDLPIFSVKALARDYFWKKNTFELKVCLFLKVVDWTELNLALE